MEFEQQRLMKAAKAWCLLLLHPNHHRTPSTLLLVLPLNQQKWHWILPTQLAITTAAVPTHNFLVQPLYICKARKWDPNAESFRVQNFNYGYDDDGGDEDDEGDDTVEQWDNVLEDYIESIWIFKVFRSYGWLLPFIIVSLLLATGPKAFLLALVLPLGQSTFSFAIQRMWDEMQNKPKRKSKIKKRSRARSSRFVRRKAENRVRNQGNKNVKMGYRSWIPQDEGSKDASEDVPNFGGWDELDNGSEFDLGSPRSAAQSRSTKRPTEGGLSSRMTKSDTPLLLRLLIAVFPFLGSWTRML